MAQGVARVGDTIVGYCNGPGHSANREFVGVWVSGSGTVTADGLSVVRVGDIGVTDCNHTVVAITGASMSSADGIAVHRVGDVCVTEGNGVGTTSSGSTTVTSE